MKRILVSLAALGTAMAVWSPAAMAVVDGEKVAWERLPATCVFKARGKPECSCVLVGPEVALTANHCMREDAKKKKGRVRVSNQPGTREGNCVVSADLDLAICRVEEVKNILFEKLNRAPLPEGHRLLLTGFGCTSEFASDGGPLRIDRDAAIKSPYNSIDLLINLDNGALCSGDSGGPGYALFTADPFGPRLVAGINTGNFHLTSVSSGAASDFIRGWAQSHPDVLICGLSDDDDRCRD